MCDNEYPILEVDPLDKMVRIKNQDRTITFEKYSFDAFVDSIDSIEKFWHSDERYEKWPTR